MFKWRDAPGRKAPGRRADALGGPVVTYGLIGVCCLVFLMSPVSGLDPAYGTGDNLLAAQSAYFEHWGVVPTELMSGTAGALLTPLTALFIHANWLHLLGNMLFLYVFGAMAEERMGRLHFAVFYVVSGYIALTAYALTHSGSDQTLVGASGAISAVLGAFLSLFPRARVTSIFPFLLFLPLRFPAWIVLVFWFVLQWLAAGQQTGTGPGVAYTAHLVGFSLGFGYAAVRYWRTTRVKLPATATEGESKP
ncbi:rhomboid family intramembrane serine protease [Streptomyces sp. NPDC090052]|uniref:rhomboid family intramembrane serine protease n=1 Tax=unclassified Streptomyces TaxID=2593676 RepID=UPI0022533CF2|nr:MULTISPECIES: rhomboid family intramembrane serine protease [unclassified Streptomyces]MCX4727078.1 rhomboid family intramembrane serine protease [Streptomyces sp. NBC_01306]WSV03659.1 rhomboid family intramembrane serine protease [Streptomyces sp. NBC_01020]WSX41706.1 rhomboid family intramembrane serine protease [Streptomyces sp. NBC_00963]WSX70337.1 rhomboid family intramembrane serine protease [Streptomyces sp. NBC_00932]